MKPIHMTLALSLALSAGTALFAKEGVTNPTVKARQDTMQTIRRNTAVLGDMAGGKTAFDPAAAAAAKAELAAAAAEIPVKFEPQEGDPKSEAKPEIWTGWDDYVQKAEALVAAAEAVDTASLDGVRAGMGAIGGACKSCHETYRLD
ncbi:c-type cytochrome [Ruixingdingia sedimenti]|uniref:Cytochrome c n=1 Tax=Ruixingdingia sedimenti TaxID=3073604 RepID=A0ABU1F8S3_9RHOB|nr:cytochrome c [Xinfangfangia sp. LG-4]MDR5653284.1 cytochrome c [Xinfangfangia sp. LG-4]